MASDLVLPGQPILLPRGPIPQMGSGVYVRDGQTRASLVGTPRYEGSVGGVLS
jgi:exosome complex component CSL4